MSKHIYVINYILSLYKLWNGVFMLLTIFDVISTFIALLGLAFVTKIFLMWPHLDMSMLKAKVFLDDKFLYNSWIYLFLIGTSIMMHQILSVLINFEYFVFLMPFSITELVKISDIFELFCISFIVIFNYRWYKLLNACIFKLEDR